MPRRTIVFPLPDQDFDVTEVAVPWKRFRDAGHDVVFATEAGATPTADPLLLRGLPPGLRAADEAIALYRELEQDAAFRGPIRWDALAPARTDAIFLAGGHAPGMRQYLESTQVQRFVADCWADAKPVSAICHGVLVLARTTDWETGRSVLWKRRTTCLPKYMERSAYFMTAWALGRYYRTYDAYVEDEVRAALEDPAQQFVQGPRTLVRRGTETNDDPAFVVEDGAYASGRWPGDAYLIAKTLLAQLEARADAGQEASPMPG